MSTNSQRNKALKALKANKTNIFNTEYSVSGTGTQQPSVSYQKFQTLEAGPQAKTSANIVQRAFQNQEARYGSRPPSPYNNNSRSQSPALPNFEGGKTRKYKKKQSRKKSTKRKGTRKN